MHAQNMSRAVEQFGLMLAEITQAIKAEVKLLRRDLDDLRSEVKISATLDKIDEIKFTVVPKGEKA